MTASRRPHLDGATLLLVAWSVTMSVTSQLALRYGMSALSHRSGLDLVLDAIQAPWVIGGLGAFALGTVSWLVILSRIDLAVAYPLGALNYVLISILSASVLGELVPPLRWAGNLLILCGILFIALGERRVGEVAGRTVRQPDGPGSTGQEERR